MIIMATHKRSLRKRLELHKLRDNLFFAMAQEEGLTSFANQEMAEQINLRYELIKQLLERRGIQ